MQSLKDWHSFLLGIMHIKFELRTPWTFFLLWFTYYFQNAILQKFVKSQIKLNHEMLGLLNTSVDPIVLSFPPFSPHIVIFVPHRSTLLLLLFPYIIFVMYVLIILWPFSPPYIPRRSYNCIIQELFIYVM